MSKPEDQTSVKLVLFSHTPEGPFRAQTFALLQATATAAQRPPTSPNKFSFKFLLLEELLQLSTVLAVTVLQPFLAFLVTNTSPAMITGPMHHISNAMP